MKRITSRQHSLVRQYRDTVRRGRTDRIILDGTHLVSEGLDAGIDIQHAIVDATKLHDREVAALIGALRHRQVEIASAGSAVMTAVSPVRSPSDIVALARRPALAGPSLYRGQAPVVIIACDVQDPGNMGALIRVAEAGGASGLVAAGASADPFGWKALRGSMGSALRLPLTLSREPSAVVAEARRHGCHVVALLPRGGQSLFDARLDGPTVLLIGSEGAGVPEALIESADNRVTIPMAPPVESLNTAVSAALVIYEIRRRRGFQPVP